MSYCTVDDVQIYIGKNILSENSQPTKNQVMQMCEDTEGVIDSFISTFATLPITKTTALSYLKKWAIDCVLSSYYRAIESEPELSLVYDTKCRGYEERLIADPGIIQDPPSGIARGGGSTRPTVKWKKEEGQW